MRGVAVLCALVFSLVFALPSFGLPLYTASGWITENSQPNPSCAVNGGGDDPVFDGAVPVNGSLILLMDAGSGNTLGNCTSTGELKMSYYPSGTVFDDPAGTIQVWKQQDNTAVADSVTITGMESGMAYAFHMFRRHIDGFGRSVYDFTFIRPNNPPPSQGSELIEPAPPIRR